MLRETDHFMRASLPPFEHVRALVVGDLMLDRYWHGDTQRVSPEAPVPVVRVTRIEERAGGAGNVARNLAALGVSVELAGVVGVDEMGERLTQILVDAGVRCHFQHSAAHPTITKLRVISRNQQLLRLDFEAGFAPAQSTSLLSLLAEELPGAGALVLSDYGKGTLAEPAAWIAAARARGVPVLVDPKGRDFGRYRGATLLTPNLHEFELVAGSFASEAELEAKAVAMVHELGLDALLITRGERGMTLVPAVGEPLHLPARAIEVFDVTGAGDTVIATLAAALAGGSANRANAAIALANRRRRPRGRQTRYRHRQRR
jgi:D-beta-D-heptose 7-phosphate kinase/D-beta-D-heptose 1-phosphate adenosyltransferase